MSNRKVSHTPGPIDRLRLIAQNAVVKPHIRKELESIVQAMEFELENDAYDSQAIDVSESAALDLLGALIELLGEAEAWGVKMDGFRKACAALEKATL